MKRLLLFLIGISIIQQAYSNGIKIDDLFYILDSTNLTAEVTYPNDQYSYAYFTELTIPETITYDNQTYKVTSIGDNAFKNCLNMRGSLTIPNTVQTIGYRAFYFCGFNGSLIIGDNVQSIGDEAFYQCNSFRGMLTIPNSVKTIGKYAFGVCFLFSSLRIGNSVTTIGEGAFSGCDGFTGSLTIPNSVQTIGNEAFYGCKRFTGSLTIGENVQTIGSEAFSRCDGFYGSLTIPNSVQAIGNKAFYNCTGFNGSLTIGENVQTIGSEAFYGCDGFTGSLTIPNSVQTIGSEAFYGCDGFNGSLIIGKNVQTIGSGAFYGCDGFTGSLIIPNSVQKIGDHAFYECSGFNGSLILSENVKTIESSTFCSCSGFIGSLTIPNSVQTIGSEAFYFCTGFNGSLTIGDNVQTIGNSAFGGCYSFTGSLSIPNSVQTIGERAFYYCYRFTGSLSIPNSVQTIGERAFYYCDGFTGSLIIGEKVQTIGDETFMRCVFSEVKSFAKNPAMAGNDAFYNFYTSPLYIPLESVNLYKSAAEWKKFTNINPISEEATKIELSKQELNLTIGEEETLIATLTPEDATTEIVWSTENNDNIISVNQNGKVTALKEGTAEVTATAGDVSASCTVTVTPVYATSISISGNGVHSLKETETLQLSTLVQPDNVTYPEVTWESSNSSVAIVSDNGLVTAVSIGEVTITAYPTKQPEVKNTYSITIQKRILGDANDNGIVNIADVGTISDYIVEKPVYEFCFVNADVVTDKKITTADVTATLDIIFNDAPVIAKLAIANRKEPQPIGNLTLDNFNPSVFGSSVMGISLDENSDLVGLQATLIIPRGMTVEKVSKGNGASDHILNYNITDHGTLNFILYSLNNSTFEAKNGPLVEITAVANEDCENVQMKNILASDAFANEYSLSFSGGENKGIMTSISDTLSSEIEISATSAGIMITSAKGEIVRIFATSGEWIISETAKSDKETYALSPGIYIVTVKEKTTKLIIK